MTMTPNQLALPEATTPDILRERLAAYGPPAPPETAIFERIYYDTFDWRLYDAGLVLEQNGETWHARELQGGDPAGELESETALCFAWEMPPGALRDRLEPLIEMRALLPLVRVRGQTRIQPVLNKDEKIVARVLIEEATAYPPSGGEAAPLPPLVELRPVRGYRQELDALRAYLVEELALEPVATPPMVTAVTAAGRDPGDYSSGFDVTLDPAMRADAATRAILAAAFDALRRNEAGVLADLDSEFLHDFRVAVRRTRSALAQIKDVLPPETVAHYREEFAWLGDITTPTRDLDVYLLDFDSFLAPLPAYAQERLQPLHDYLQKQRTVELAALLKALRSARYRKLVEGWQAFLDAPLEDDPVAANALRPAGEVAGERIWKMARRTRDEALAIDSETPAETVHDLRKTAKKLRYLIEFFQSFYPPEDLKKSVRELKRVQDVLGEFQDRQVQIETLERFAQDMAATGEYPAETLLAMGVLTGHLYKLELAARDALPDQLERYTRPKSVALMRDLFKPARVSKTGEKETDGS